MQSNSKSSSKTDLNTNIDTSSCFRAQNSQQFTNSSATKNAEVDAPLGINTKSSSPCDSRKSEANLVSGKAAFRIIRNQRYQLLRTARAVYAKQGEKSGFKYVLNYHKTAKCAYASYNDVIVNMSEKYKKAHLGHIVTCGRVHTCPVCSAKIEERRRKEIEQAVNYWYSLENKTVAMLTFTFSHSAEDSLASLLARQKTALKKLRSGKAWEKIKEVFGFDSLIRSLEVTYSEQNGFHPHTHELWCIDKNINRERLENFLKSKFKAKRHAERLEYLFSLNSREIFNELILERWESCCEKSGLMIKSDGKLVDRESFLKHALDIKFDVSIGDYLAKQDDSRNWGVDREMSKGSSKNASKKGMHPFKFLANFSSNGEGKWAKLWIEYTRDIDGKRRLFWTHGLKRKVGINEKTDEELAAEKEETATIVYRMNDDEWKKARHNIPLVLSSAEDNENLEKVIDTIQPIDFYVEASDAEMKKDQRILYSKYLDDKIVKISDDDLKQFIYEMRSKNV